MTPSHHVAFFDEEVPDVEIANLSGVTPPREGDTISLSVDIRGAEDVVNPDVEHPYTVYKVVQVVTHYRQSFSMPRSELVVKDRALVEVILRKVP